MSGFWITSVFATVVLIVRLVLDLRAGAVATGVFKWSQRFGLSLTDEVRPFLLRRRRMSSLGYTVGLWVGMEIGASATMLLPEQQWGFATGLATQAAWWVSGGLGAVILGNLAVRLSPVSGPRVARTRVITVADYVDPIDRMAVLIAAVVALLFGLMPLLEGALGPAAASSAGAGIGGVLVVGIAETVARVAVRSPQRASSPHALAWSDALRSETVRNALLAGASLAIATLVVSVPTVLRLAGSTARPGSISLWTGVGLVALLAVFGIRSMLTEPARYFLRRLWPATAAELAEHERPKEEVSR